MNYLTFLSDMCELPTKSELDQFFDFLAVEENGGDDTFVELTADATSIPPNTKASFVVKTISLHVQLHVACYFYLSETCSLIGLDYSLVATFLIGNPRTIYNGMSINPGEKVSQIVKPFTLTKRPVGGQEGRI